MKKRFKAITVVAAVLLALCLGQTAYATEGGGMTAEEYQEYLEDLLSKVTTGQGSMPQDAKVSLMSEETVSFSPGEARTITVKVKNIGDRAAKDVQVKASSGGADAPISFELDSGSQRISTLLKNSEKDLSIHVRATSAAEEGVYPIDLTFTYRDFDNAIVNDTVKVYVKIVGTTAAPELVIHDFSAGTGGTPAAGDGFTLSAVLQNVGEADAKEVQVHVEGFDPAKIYLTGDSNNQYYSSMKAGESQTMSFSLAAHKDIKSGSYPLTFSIKYLDDKNAEKTRENIIYYVNIQGSSSSEDRANLMISQMSQLSGEYNVDQVFTVEFEVANNGAEAAKNVKVTAVPDDAEAIKTSSVSKVTVPQLEPGASAKMSFSFFPTSKAATQNYAVGFKVEYETGIETAEGAPETDSFEQFVGVNVNNPDADEEEEEEKISKPKIIIDTYEVDPIIVKAGQEFGLSMSFRNTHPTKTIENIKVTLTPNESTQNGTSSTSPFMPVDGSNTFYIARITPGQTSDRDFRMYAIPNAEPSAYTITVDFAYQDTDYNEYTEKEIIGVTVKQTTKLDTGNIMVPTEAFVGQPLYVNFSLMNTGKSTLNNLTVEIEGEGMDAVKSFMYFGSLNKSGSSYYDGEITPLEVGQQPGKVLITYEDDAGEVTSIERDFVLNVMDMADMEMPGMEDFPMELPPEEGGGGLSQWIEYAKKPWVWAGVAALAVAAFFGKKLYDKKRRPKYDE